MLPRRFYLDSIFDNFMDEKVTDQMKCDIFEKDESYHIVVDMPGVNKKDITVECHDGYLTISTEKEEEVDTNDKKFIRKERLYGKMSRKFYVGDVAEDEIRAEFKDGVLTICIPKINKENSKKIIDIE